MVTSIVNLAMTTVSKDKHPERFRLTAPFRNIIMKQFAPPPPKATPFWRSLSKRSQNAQPQDEILCSKGLGGAALNKRFCDVAIHKHCLRGYNF